MGVSGVKLHVDMPNSWLSGENVRVLPNMVYRVVDFSGRSHTSVYLRKVTQPLHIRHGSRLNN